MHQKCSCIPMNGYSQQHKASVEDTFSINVFMLHRKSLLTEGLMFEWRWFLSGQPDNSLLISTGKNCLFLVYGVRLNGQQEWQPVEQKICLTWIPCNFGGHRPYFVCPSCGQRAAFLYGVDLFFLCRRCSGLAYASQSENKSYRALRKARKLRQRLCAPANLDQPVMKPPRMHWRTYFRLLNKAVQAEREATCYMYESLLRSR